MNKNILPTQLQVPQLMSSNWTTDWKKHIVPYDEIVAVKEKDAIPALDKPQFTTIKEAMSSIKDIEPVIVVKMGNEARAYPLSILMYHEVINDTISGIPIVVTYCPLCSSEYVFKRRIKKTVLEFGTSGLLRHSNLILYDRSTDSLWQQFTGQAIIGDYIGHKLEFVPSNVVSFKEFYTTEPMGLVLSFNTGYKRDYGTNPYVNYDDLTNYPPFFKGSVNKTFSPMQRVLGIKLGSVTKTYPYSLLNNQPIIYDQISNIDYVIFFKQGTASALNTPTISEGQDIGSTGVFYPFANGMRLEFSLNSKGEIIDQNTNSSWTNLGKAVSGSLTGKQLLPLIHVDPFWFAWSTFYENTEIIE